MAQDHRLATPEELSAYEEGAQAILDMEGGNVLDDPDTFVWFACFDGTRNDKEDHRLPRTNIARLADDIEAASRVSGWLGARFGAGYVHGPGAGDVEQIGEDWWLEETVRKARDSIDGASFRERISMMYFRCCNAFKDHQFESPNAKLHIVSAGFSRGAALAALFTRFVHKHGLCDPDHITMRQGEYGWHYDFDERTPRILPPGRCTQSALLFDPVTTGSMDKMDMRLPKSVTSALQFSAADEKRADFTLRQIVPNYAVKSMANIVLPGSHSDVGGGYKESSLALRTYELSHLSLGKMLGDAWDALKQKMVEEAPHGSDVIHDSGKLSPYGNSLLAREFAPYNTLPIRRVEPAQSATTPWKVEAFGRSPKDIQMFDLPAEQLHTVPSSASQVEELHTPPSPPPKVEEALESPSSEADEPAWKPRI